MIYIQKHSSPEVLIELKKEISKGKSFESIFPEQIRKDYNNMLKTAINFSDLLKKE